MEAVTIPILDNGKENLIINFCKEWIAALTSLTYSYYISKTIKPGIVRLISLLPIISLFTLLPLTLYPSPHLCANTAFFLAFLSNFKLLLFAFDNGPLISSSPISLIRFISIASLPIKTKQPQNSKATGSLKSPLYYTAKFLLFTMLLLRTYDHRSLLDHKFLLAIYCLHVYLGLEPTWEVSWFFVLHGLCTALEVLVKERSELGEKRRVMRRVVSMVVTMGFLMGTIFWFMLPQLVRNRVD